MGDGEDVVIADVGAAGLERNRTGGVVLRTGIGRYCKYIIYMSVCMYIHVFKENGDKAHRSSARARYDDKLQHYYYLVQSDVSVKVQQSSLGGLKFNNCFTVKNEHFTQT